MQRSWSGCVVLLALSLLVSAGGCGDASRSGVRVDFASALALRKTGGNRPQAAAASTAEFDGWGHMTGRFLFSGTPPSSAKINRPTNDACDKFTVTDETVVVGDAGGLANVVIYLITKIGDENIEPSLAGGLPQEAILDNKNCRFEPHVLPIWFAQQKMILKNSDQSGHNSNLAPSLDAALNPLIPPGNSITHQFGREQSKPFAVTCNIHPWMKGYILPRGNPYMAVTGADGRFKIEKLPAGELEFAVWHEQSDMIQQATVDGTSQQWPRGRFKVTIPRDGEVDLGDMTLSADLF